VFDAISIVGRVDDSLFAVIEVGEVDGDKVVGSGVVTSCVEGDGERCMEGMLVGKVEVDRDVS